jgi:hypothetical protein
LPTEWSAEDWKAFVINLFAGLALLAVADIAVRLVLSVVLGTRARLSIEPAGDQRAGDVDWPHLRVTNIGLPFARRTRAVEGVIAHGTFDGSPVVFGWSTTGDWPPEEANIYGRRHRDIPVTARLGANSDGVFKKNFVKAGVAHLTEIEFMTQGFHDSSSGKTKLAPWPLTNSLHRLDVTVQAIDGTTSHASFDLNVPLWPTPITIRRRAARWPWFRP